MLTGVLYRKVNGEKEGRPRTNCSFPSQFASAAQLNAELWTALPTVRRLHVRLEWISSGSLPVNQITAIRWSDPFVASWLAAASLEGAQEQHSTARPSTNNLLREASSASRGVAHHLLTNIYVRSPVREDDGDTCGKNKKDFFRIVSSPGIPRSICTSRYFFQCAVSNSFNRTISLSSYLQS